MQHDGVTRAGAYHRCHGSPARWVAIAAGLVPLMLAIASIVVALAMVALLGQAYALSVFTQNMLIGMGLALGIDYSLFTLSRYREERLQQREKLDAITVAGATAGRAVLFSGIAFVLAMLGLLLVPSTIFRSLAVGAILVGIVSVVAALTLLPAVLSPEHTGNALPFVFERHQLRAAFDLHAGSSEPVVQDALRFRLRYQQDERVKRIRRADVPQRCRRHWTTLEMQLQARASLSAGDEPFGEPERLQQLQRARLDGERPRFMGAVLQAIDDPERHLEPSKLGCQREPMMCMTSARSRMSTPRSTTTTTL